MYDFGKLIYLDLNKAGSKFVLSFLNECLCFGYNHDSFIQRGLLMKPEEFTRNIRPVLQQNFNKIFVIGYNKTGTTTMERVLRLYGYSMPNQQEQEARLTRQVFSTNYEEFKCFVAKYDAFQDLPFSQEQTYVVADALFPNSRFILTERDSEQWFLSMTTFTKKLFKIDRLI